MAISGVSGGSYRNDWEQNGGIYGNSGDVDGTESSDTQQHIWNAVFTDKKSNGLNAEDFISLMVAQMTNQDFMNPADDTQMITQLAQMSNMQMMQEMANYTKTGYIMSLVGKTVTAARISVSGELLKETGPVEKVSLTNNEFAFYVNGKRFTLEQLMEVGTSEGVGGSGEATATPEETLRKKEYLNSLLGHEVTIEAEDEFGSYEVLGVVEKVSTRDGKYQVYVNGKWYDLDKVREVGGKKVDSSREDDIPKVDDTDGTGSSGSVDDNDTTDGTDGTDETPPEETVPTPETGESTEPEEPESPEDTDEAVGGVEAEDNVEP